MVVKLNNGEELRCGFKTIGGASVSKEDLEVKLVELEALRMDPAYLDRLKLEYNERSSLLVYGIDS